MAEYIERQKAFDALPKVKEDRQITLYGAVMDFMVLVSSIPAADVVEVVRCKDCRHSETCPDRILWCNECNMLAEPDGYCYRGERRNDDG